MTLVTSLSGLEGAMLFADTQETVGGYGKRTVEKMEVWNVLGHPFRFGIASSTNSGTYSDSLQTEIVGTLLSTSNSDMEHIRKSLEERLTKFYADHVWPQSGDRPQMEYLLIIQPLPSGRPEIFHIYETAANIVAPQTHWKSIGVGAYLADYLLGRMLTDIPRGDMISHLAAAGIYTAKEVRENIDGVGPVQRVAIFKDDGSFDMLFPDDIEAIEQNFSAMDEALHNFFQDAMDVTDGITRTDGLDSARTLAIDMAIAHSHWFDHWEATAARRSPVVDYCVKGGRPKRDAAS